MKNRERERERDLALDFEIDVGRLISGLLVFFLVRHSRHSSQLFRASDRPISLSTDRVESVCLRERVKGFLLSFFFSSLPTPFYRKVKRWVFLGDQIDGSDVLGGIHPTDSRYSRNRLCFWAWVVFPLFTLLGFRAKILSPSLVSPNEAWVNTQQYLYL